MASKERANLGLSDTKTLRESLLKVSRQENTLYNERLELVNVSRKPTFKYLHIDKLEGARSSLRCFAARKKENR